MSSPPSSAANPRALRRRAVQRLASGGGKDGSRRTPADPRRLVQELQVHQVELEMQNSELQDARNRLETLLEKYTDLYDFAPIGYFSLDERGAILEVNLTGALMLGVERSLLLRQSLLRFVAPASREDFRALLTRVFARPGKQVCEIVLSPANGIQCWVNIQAIPAILSDGPERSCRAAILDISALKRADEAQQRAAALAVANLELKGEIERRRSAEASLRKSRHQQDQMLLQSRRFQQQLRSLSHRILRAQEDERKRISRELHDEVVQALVGINVHLGALAGAAGVNRPALRRHVAHTQRLIKNSVAIVHRFARDLRPTVLDDLGLIPALHSYLKEFSERTRTRVRFTAAATAEQLTVARRIVLYRVAQSALLNVAQHAHASAVKVSLRNLRGFVRLEIQDNGRGFDAARVLFAKRHRRLGVVGMRERVEMVGGSFHVAAVPGRGTTIRADIPCRRGGRPRAA